METHTRKKYAEAGKMMHGVFFEFWECKCGNLEEISVSVDIEWYVCKECKRGGLWNQIHEERSIGFIPGQ